MPHRVLNRPMSERDEYPAGVPCWVDTLQVDVQAALDFYGELFGWTFDGPGPLPGGLPGQYYLAQLGGREVAGIGTLPGGSESQAIAVWSTYVAVESVDDAVARTAAAGGTVMLGPLDAAPAGRGAVLADPTGAAICVWEAQDRAGAGRVNEPNTWLMSSLHTPDTDAAAGFYRTLFGWEPAPWGPVTVFRLPGYDGDEGQRIPQDAVAVMAPPDTTVTPNWSVNVRVEDADAAAARTVELGGSVMHGPLDMGGMRSAVLADPQGAVFVVTAS